MPHDAQNQISQGYAKTNRMEILVHVTNQYGNERIFPACKAAEHFAAIAGAKTLTQSSIDHIKALGYTVRVISAVDTL